MSTSTFLVLFSQNGYIIPTPFASLSSALGYCRERLRFLHQEGYLDDKELVTESIIAWNNGYGSDIDRIHGNTNYINMVTDSLDNKSFFVAWAYTSPFKCGEMCDIHCTILRRFHV